MYDPLQVRKSSARADYWVQFDPKTVENASSKVPVPSRKVRKSSTRADHSFSRFLNCFFRRCVQGFPHIFGPEPVFDGIRRDHVPRQGERRDAQWDTRQDIPQYDSWAGDGNGFAQIDKAVNRFD